MTTTLVPMLDPMLRDPVIRDAAKRASLAARADRRAAQVAFILEGDPDAAGIVDAIDRMLPETAARLTGSRNVPEKARPFVDQAIADLWERVRLTGYVPAAPQTFVRWTARRLWNIERQGWTVGRQDAARRFVLASELDNVADGAPVFDPPARADRTASPMALRAILAGLPEIRRKAFLQAARKRLAPKAPPKDPGRAARANLTRLLRGNGHVGKRRDVLLTKAERKALHAAALNLGLFDGKARRAKSSEHLVPAGRSGDEGL